MHSGRQHNSDHRCDPDVYTRAWRYTPSQSRSGMEWLWPVSRTLRACKVWNSLFRPTLLTKITLVFAFNKQNSFYRMVESNPKNRRTLTGVWTTVLLLPALHVPFKPPYIHQAFSLSALSKRWVCLCLGITSSMTVSDYRFLSCPCTKRNPEGCTSCFYLNTDLRVDDLCPFTVLSSPKEIIFTVTVQLPCIFLRSAGRTALCCKSWACPGFRRKST